MENFPIDRIFNKNKEISPKNILKYFKLMKKNLCAKILLKLKLCAGEYEELFWCYYELYNIWICKIDIMF